MARCASGQINGEFVVNPSYLERRDSKINITVVGTKDGIVMIESGASEASEETIVDAIEFGHTEIKKIVAAIEDLVSRAGKPKRAVKAPEFDSSYYEALLAKDGQPAQGCSRHQGTSQAREPGLW